MAKSNLIPNSERSPEELREMGRKGGIKSGESRRRNKRLRECAALLAEAAGFFAGRIATGAFDTLFMIVAVDMLHLPNLVMKVASNVVVIILNYVISKLLVFRSSDGSED